MRNRIEFGKLKACVALWLAPAMPRNQELQRRGLSPPSTVSVKPLQ